jgi:raffinose/stachyose/melibiose transport system substrate-binding protein
VIVRLRGAEKEKKMKRTRVFMISLLVLLLSVPVFLAVADPVAIVFGSWRTEDIDRMNRINQVFQQKNPNIQVQFSPTKNTEYDAQVRSSLAAGVGPDVMFTRSYDGGRVLYDSGYLQVLNTLVPGIATLPETAQNAWRTEDGKEYSVPILGVAHGVYYNKDTFDKYGLKEPKTWGEFLAACKKLKDNGETVIAQGIKEPWSLYEVVYSGLGPNFYGGEKSRQKLIRGQMKLTDKPFVDAFAAIKELVPYFATGYQGLNYVDMQQLFVSGKAAMYIGGSWELGPFKDMGLDFNMGWFAPPVVHAGDRLQYCFHVDSGLGLNAKSKHQSEAVAYLKWTTTPEFAQLLMNELPGLYSFVPGDYNFSNPVAKKILDTSKNADLTVRTVWEKLSAQDPSGNILMWEAMFKLCNGDLSPSQAAAYVQDRVASWYKPFKK